MRFHNKHVNPIHFRPFIVFVPEPGGKGRSNCPSPALPPRLVMTFVASEIRFREYIKVCPKLFPRTSTKWTDDEISCDNE